MANRETIYDTPGYVGIILPDRNLVTANLLDNDAAAGNSDYTENTRRPGRAVFDQAEVALTSGTAGDYSPSMAIIGTGEQDADKYHVKVLRGGFPGTCTVVQRPALTTADKWRGKQTHNVLTHIDSSTQIDAGSSTTTVNYAMCTAADGTVLMAIGDSGGVIRIVRYDPGAKTVGAGAIEAADTTIGPAALTQDEAFYSTEMNGSTDLQCVELLPTANGRIYMFAMVLELGWTGAAGASRQVMSSYSDDYGLTWRTASYLMLDNALAVDADVLKIRACEGLNGDVLLLVEYTWDSGTTYGAVQFASSDGGHTFQEVQDWQTATAAPSGWHFDCVSDPVSGLITVLYYRAADYKVSYRQIASPFSPILSAPENTIKTLTAGQVSNVTGYADYDGTLYCTWDAGQAIEMARSFDGGATWHEFSTDPFQLATSTDHYWDVTAAGGGAVWMVCDPDATIAGGSTPFFTLCHSGTWDTLTHPQVKGAEPRELAGFGSGSVWIGQRDPSNYAWTANGAGTSTDKTTAPFGINITTAANTRFYSDATTNDSDTGVTLWWALEYTSGGTLTANECAVRVQIEDASGGYEWDVVARFDGSQVRVVDRVAGAAIATANIDTTTQKVFKLAVRKWPNTTSPTAAGVTLYSRDTLDDDWTAIVKDDNGLSRRNPGIGSTASVIQFGALATSTADHDWSNVSVMRYTGNVGRISATESSYGFYDDLCLNPLQSSPYSLWGAVLPAAPARLPIKGGLFLHGESGPATRGDSWQVVPAYDFPVSNLDVVSSQSPRKVWRSAADGSLMRIGWAPDGSNNTWYGPSSGLPVFKANIKTALYRGWNGSAWVTLGTLDFRGDMTSLPYTRSGNTVYVDTGTSFDGQQWIALNELAGCTVDLGSGKLRKVASNSEGSWTDTTTRRPRLTLSGVDGTEPASGTLDIWYQEGVILIHNQSTGYSRYAIEISSQSTADGFYQLGLAPIGPLYLFGTKYSRNRTVSTAPNAEVFRSRDGSGTGKKHGPAARRIEASWVEGVDSTALWRPTPAPDYLAMRTGIEPGAAVRDITLLEGMVDYLGGPANLCVYMPHIPLTAASGGSQDITLLVGRERVMLVRLMDTVSRTTSNGNEVVDEVVTITGFVAEEER